MHTVRNRKGARSPMPNPSQPQSGKTGTGKATADKAQGKSPTARPPATKPQQSAPFLLASAGAPAFPADLILPPHRGAIITTAAWPAGMIPAPLPAVPPFRSPLIAPRVPAGNPQGQPDREAPSRNPNRQAPPRKTPHRDLPPRPGTRTARKAERRARIEAELARRTATAPTTAGAMAQASVTPEAPARPATPPSVKWVAPDDRTPLPRHRAPAVPRQGLLDVVAATLGDAGRMLARLLPGGKRNRELRERVARAEARLRVMEAQLAALEALRERVKT